jgi:putative flippase GtrA
MRDGLIHEQSHGREHGQTRLDRATRIMLARCFVRALVGAAAIAVHYVFLVAVVSMGMLGPVAATMVGAILGAATHFALDTRVSLRGPLSVAAASRFVATAALAAAANGALMAALLAVFPLDYLAAQLLATAILLCASFCIHPAWIFRVTKAR